MEEADILALYFERSEEAISETDRKYGAYCRSIASRILNNDQDAEECVSDTFLRAWNSIPPKRPSVLRTYLGKLTRNLSLNRREKQMAGKRGSGQVPLVLEELEECIPGVGSDPDRLTEDIVIRDALNAFLGSLPGETRRIFLMRYWYLCPIKEIAREMGTRENTVAVTLFRTREKLRTALEKEGITV